MNYKNLYKAMRFMFLPTLVMFSLLLVGFWSVAGFWNFITSDSPGAVIVRVALFTIEIMVVAMMYLEYQKDDEIRNTASGIIGESGDNIKTHEKTIEKNSAICNAFTEINYGDTVQIFSTTNPNIKVIKRIPR